MEDASNGLLMSDSEASVKLHGNKLYHSSRHKKYTDMVIGKLNHIKERFDRGKIISRGGCNACKSSPKEPSRKDTEK